MTACRFGRAALRAGVIALLLALSLGACSLSAEPTDLRVLKRSATPNDALACPAGLCAASADRETPRFDLPLGVLRDILAEIAAAEPRTELVAESRALDQRVYVQRSRVFGFPDRIHVQVVALPEGASAILYSKAGYGVWDLGVNRKRVKRWLKRLDAAIAARRSGAS